MDTPEYGYFVSQTKYVELGFFQTSLFRQPLKGPNFIKLFN